VRRRAVGHAEIQLARMRLGVSNKLANAADRRFWARHHDVRDFGDHRDRHEPFRIVFGVPIKRRADGKRGGAAKKKRVAIGLGIGGDLAGQRRTGAWPIVNKDLLADLVRQRLADQPAHDVGRTAGRERHDQPNRSAWIGLLRDRSVGPGDDGDDRHCENVADS
jgi:hypothetical protein